MKKIIISLLVVLLLVTQANALEFIGTCSGDELEITLNYTFNGDERFFEEEPFLCPYGCVENLSRYGDACAYSPAEENARNSGIPIAISIILSAIAIAFVYLSLNMTDENGVLGWYFLIFSLVIMAANLFMLTQYIVDAGIVNILSSTGYALIITIVFLLFYFMVFFITKGFKRLTERDSRSFGDTLRP